MNILVIGGTLFIGRYLVEQLLDAGHEITILHRRESNDFGDRVRNLQADRNDSVAMSRIFESSRFDAVFDNVYDWERGTGPDQVAEPAKLAGPQLTRYVYMSSVAAYGSGLDHTEDDELAPVDDPNPYVSHKASTERALFRMHRETGFPVVTLRPPFIYGPGNPFYREAFFWDRLRDERPIILPNGGDRLMHFTYIHDLVWACVRVLDHPGAVGEAFNIGDTAPVTQAQLIQLLADAAGVDAQTIDVPRERIQEQDGHAMGPNLYFGTYFDLPPITMSIEKARAVLGFEPTSLREGLEKTYAWYHQQFEPRRDYEFEDRLLESMRISPKAFPPAQGAE